MYRTAQYLCRRVEVLSQFGSRSLFWPCSVSRDLQHPKKCRVQKGVEPQELLSRFGLFVVVYDFERAIHG